MAKKRQIEKKENVAKSFFMKLFAEGTTDTISSKRLIAVLSFTFLVILSFLSAFGFSPMPDFVYILGALAGGQSLLTTVERMSKLKNRSTDVVNSNDNLELKQ